MEEEGVDVPMHDYEDSDDDPTWSGDENNSGDLAARSSRKRRGSEVHEELSEEEASDDFEVSSDSEFGPDEEEPSVYGDGVDFDDFINPRYDEGGMRDSSEEGEGEDEDEDDADDDDDDEELIKANDSILRNLPRLETTSKQKKQQQQMRDDLSIVWTEAETANFDVEQDESDAEEDQYGRLKARKKTNKGKVAPGEHQLTHEVQVILSACIECFTKKDYESAISLAEEAIRQDMNCKQAYRLLEDIYEDLGQPEKLLSAKIMVVHFEKKNKEKWLEVADMSREMGLKEQASELYRRAQRVDPTDYRLMYLRAQLFDELGKRSKALDLYWKLRQRGHYDNRLLLSICQNLMALNKIREAVSLYEEVLRKNQEDRYRTDVESFGFSELNVLAELYMQLNDHGYARAIRKIKSTCRWLKEREDEVWWDEYKDDTEYLDDRRVHDKRFQKSKSSKDPSKYFIPIDIRVKLLICRIKERQFDIAREHLEYLRRLSPLEYEDLYWAVGEAFFKAEQYEDALELFEVREEAIGATMGIESEMKHHMARCRKMLGDYEGAESDYLEVLENEEKNVEAIIELAELYGDMGKTEEARALLEHGKEMRVFINLVKENESADIQVQSELQQELEESGKRVQSWILDAPKGKKPGRRPAGDRPARVTKEVQRDIIRRAGEETKQRYSQLMRHRDGMFEGNPVSISEYLRIAGDLYDTFVSNRRFFLTDRRLQYPGETKRRGRKPKQDDIDARIAQMSNRLKDIDIEEGEQNEEEQVPVKFRELSFDVWFEFFMEYALALSRYDSDITNSYNVLQTAREANVFFQHPEREFTIEKVYLSVALYIQDADKCQELLRHLQATMQFSNDGYRLTSFVGFASTKALELFVATFNQKYFLRQIKAVDSVIQDRPISGAARVTTENFNHENPVLLALYGCSMLAGKSFVPALTYFRRAQEILPKDEMILLCTGISFIHRSIQRLTSNRHLHIVEGLSYLMEYHEIRTKKGYRMEADYNLGRAFHMVGLPSLAMHFYNQVLKSSYPHPAYDYRQEAAYNLSLIYATSGNGKLARSVIDQHLVI
ncbi:transcription factor tau 131 kDa subunit [Trichomonascus vanleenenianus]|uniref:transcription factor TFIIIC subunit TFC4 n=1 Tax=Trichomonascus vanleenenianus TaxID=2268995 RepID=UPI003ECBA1A9